MRRFYYYFINFHVSLVDFEFLEITVLCEKIENRNDFKESD